MFGDFCDPGNQVCSGSPFWRPYEQCGGGACFTFLREPVYYSAMGALRVCYGVSCRPCVGVRDMEFG